MVSFTATDSFVCSMQFVSHYVKYNFKKRFKIKAQIKSILENETRNAVLLVLSQVENESRM